ncbi:MAG: beta-glucosidase, partial [Methylophilaceae bacterium]
TEGIVLLQNSDSFLPINSSTNITIAVIGENATKSMTIGGGSSELKADYEVSPLEGLRKQFKNATIIHSPGYSSESKNEKDKQELKKEALSIAKTADVVLFIGGLNKNHSQDSESSDRQHYNLPYNQDDLIGSIAKVNKNISVILISGNAVSMPWRNKVMSIVQSWYLGSEAGNALASIIGGKISPSGKLPFSFPKKLLDNAAHFYGELSYPGNGETQFYKEDILVGYRWHDTRKITPNFAFGHGLSYTSFNLLNIKSNKKNYNSLGTIKISCEVKNNGDMLGSEVVQVYVGKKKSKVNRATKELKGFKKISILKGDTKKLEIDIPVDKLAFYDEENSDWNIEKGEYIIYVGNASDNISKELKITIR